MRHAVDIVLLTPDPISDKAIDFNRLLQATNPGGIILGTFRNLPHISLLMGCLSDDHINKATSRLNALSEHKSVGIVVKAIHTGMSGTNSVVSFDIERSEELVALHKLIVTQFFSILTQDAEEENVNDPPPIATSTLNWINRFIPHACFDKFWPHITLGFGTYSGSFVPFQFPASRLAICYLGNHCTCTEIIHEVSLR